MSLIKTPYQVFVSDTVDCPNGLPDQLFFKAGFDFLLTIGGNLVDNEAEFKALMSLFEELKEKEFYIWEHATQLGKALAFGRKFALPISYNDFEKELELYSPFGPQVSSWYVYGNNQDWGIYLAERPSINIIGCKKHLANKFRQVFNISNSGYSELKEFVRQELRKEELIHQFEINYGLKGA